VESALQQEESDNDDDGEGEKDGEEEEGAKGEEDATLEGPAHSSFGADTKGESGGGDTDDEDAAGEGEGEGEKSTSFDKNAEFLETKAEAERYVNSNFAVHTADPLLVVSPARPTSAHTLFLLESPLQLRDQQPGPADSPVASPEQPHNGHVDLDPADLVPTPHGRGLTLRPLTASMVDALPPSGQLDRAGQQEQQGAIEDYSAAAYQVWSSVHRRQCGHLALNSVFASISAQMFKNRALADLLFDGGEADVAEDDVDDMSGREEEDGEDEGDGSGGESGGGTPSRSEDCDASHDGALLVEHEASTKKEEEEEPLDQCVREVPEVPDVIQSVPAETATPPAPASSVSDVSQQVPHAPPVVSPAVGAVHPATAYLLSSQRLRQLSTRLEALRREVEAEDEAVKVRDYRICCCLQADI